VAAIAISGGRSRKDSDEESYAESYMQLKNLPYRAQ